MIDLSSKIIVITGAAGGIGAETARLLSSAGACLALCDRDIVRTHALRDELPGADRVVSCHEMDVADSASCTRSMQEIAEKHGRIDHLVHCAGIYPEGLVSDITDEGWQETLAINLNGSFYVCRAAIPFLAEDSSIVHLASVAGHRGSYGHAHYAASKGAVTSFTKSLALELAPRTRVNAIAPGVIETEMTRTIRDRAGDELLSLIPSRRFGTASDVAGAIAYLCSDLARYVTGATLHVNGGLYLA